MAEFMEEKREQEQQMVPAIYKLQSFNFYKQCTK
jgi:hypothetical protein